MMFNSKIKSVIDQHGISKGSILTIRKIIQVTINKFFKKNRLNLWSKFPPYKYVQDITEFNIHNYLGTEAKDIKSWCIVGGFDGGEIPNILANYKSCKVTVFECSKRYVTNLRERFKLSDKVRVVEKAVSNTIGKSTFFETSVTGSGSLLQVGNLASKSYGMRQAETFEVETTTLDMYFDDNIIDVLQIDVQGAERLVLDGAKKILKKTKAVFIEISIKPDMYKDCITLDDLIETLKQENLQLVLLGTDTNGGGNALFIKNEYIGDNITI